MCMSEYYMLTSGAKLPLMKTLGMKAKYGTVIRINHPGLVKIVWSA